VRFGSEIRARAAHIIATCNHNNPAAQVAWLSSSVLPILIRILEIEKDDSVRHKVVAAVSALSSHNGQVRARLFSAEFIALLLNTAGTSASAQVRCRILFFLNQLLIVGEGEGVQNDRLQSFSSMRVDLNPLIGLSLDPSVSAQLVRERGQDVLLLLCSNDNVHQELQKLELEVHAKALAGRLLSAGPSEKGGDQLTLVTEVGRLQRLATYKSFKCLSTCRRVFFHCACDCCRCTSSHSRPVPGPHVGIMASPVLQTLQAYEHFILQTTQYIWCLVALFLFRMS